MAGLGVPAVQAEVAQAHELEAGGSCGIRQGRLHLAAGEDLQGVGVQALQKVLVGGVRDRKSVV